jgi:hypothetical protein
MSVRTQVRCDSGIADVVTENEIYELKHKLDRTTFFQALGQVLLYRQSINPRARALVVCRTSIVPELHALANRMGVEVLLWPKQLRKPSLGHSWVTTERPTSNSGDQAQIKDVGDKSKIRNKNS